MVVLLAASACAEGPSSRVRADFQAPLNADAGWAGGLDEQVTIAADRPFRLRMELEAEATGAAPDRPAAYLLQVRRNTGAWETLEAHGFPYPKRELEMSFEGLAPGSSPPDWTLIAGSSDNLAVVAGDDQPALRASGGPGGLVALYNAPWPLQEFAFGTRFRLPAGARDGFSMVFAYVDGENYGRAEITLDGRIRIIRVAEGNESILAEQRTTIIPGNWHEVELQLEAGHLAVNLDDDTLEFTTPIGAGLPVSDVGIMVPANGMVELADIVVEGQPRSPLVSIVATQAYNHGAGTEDLLPGSRAPFTPGAGISLKRQTPPWAVVRQQGRQHGEFEWPLVIRRHADGPLMNEDGDRFAFRMVDDRGAALPGSPVAQVRLTVPPGHLGGTFVETPGRIGPWQARNGDLYFIMEPSETDNRFMMMKSTDSGRSWREVDGANRPATGDLESVDGRLVGDTIHIVHQITQTVFHHAFRISDHPDQPDTWAIRDEVAAEGEAHSQMATLVVRPDGSMVTVYLADRLHYAVRSPDGHWAPGGEIDPGSAVRNAGPQAVLGRDGVVHLAYFTADGAIWYRRILPDGTLTPRQQLASGAGTEEAEYGAVLPLVYDGQNDVVHIVYRLADGTLWQRRVGGDNVAQAAVMVTERPVITHAVDSQQPAADLILDGDTAHVLFVEQSSRSIWSTRNDGARWQAPVLQVEGIAGSWVRGSIIRKPDGTRALAYVYDAGSEGGSGFNRYAEIPLDPGSE
ncbi:glycoside hydrolase [Altererythrobacter sp. KTW20L]|uniref:sialidase family protein n=2 Tax=Bacteria TaxID=2 RepID=UPI0020BD6016|nr:sialidase family protein [Altererythrobacter sp. KTW20L]MCL6250823.1 glycoside hydrolase [Altererythrobacter sp. KTW20L]